MIPFEQLTPRGRVRRLRDLAVRALDEYDLVAVRVRFVADDTNTTFRVDAGDGASYALRVGAQRSDTDVDVATEMAWLTALQRDTDLPVVVPCRNRSGALVTEVGVAGVPERRRCVLFEWLPGVVLDDRATVANSAALGEIAAGLHEHGRRWDPPDDAQPLVWDRIFYYPTEPVVMFDDEHCDVITPERRAVIDEVIGRAGAELAALHRSSACGYLHGDLNPWNVKVYRGRLAVFDFEDVSVGHPVQDVAVALFYGRQRQGYDDLRAAFRAGYERVGTWPVDDDGQLELLMAARSVMFVNYVLRTGGPDDGEFSPARYTARVVERLHDFLDRYPDGPSR